MAFATETYTIQGMQQDMSDLMSDNKYSFENKNIRLTVDDETTNLVVTQEKGNKQVTGLYLTENFFSTEEELKDKYPIYPTSYFIEYDSLPFVVIGHCEIDKYLVVFGKVTKGDALFKKNNDIIIRFEKQKTNGEERFFGWIIYNNNELNFSIEYPLETIGNVETNLIKKVYFVDGINVPRCVNTVLPDSGELANINIGYSLQLKDELSVVKDNTIVGNYPMGKVRFFYTYYNDLQSETNIVDWSPYFDCNYDNQGGAEDSQLKTKFSFRINITNLDTQFKYVRIYMQHFTSPDPQVYTMKYAEYNIQNQTNLSVVLPFDYTGFNEATESYLDIKLKHRTFIPYTFAEKNNRLFYGNIKNKPSLIKYDIFKNTANVTFYQKQIGDEDLTKQRVYLYESSRTTFKDSNFEYMGFRKHNWYRFGIIAQHYSGEWSNVFYITDACCNVSSKTEIEYDNNNIPLYSKYYIPKARLNVNNRFIKALQTLQQYGYRRIKPVCVVPNYDERIVLSQGLANSTLYKGGDRNTMDLNKLNNGLFAIPSYFFRPIPLFSNYFQSISNKVLTPISPFTIRSIKDLYDKSNIMQGDFWKLNPKFDDESRCTYNIVYREFRHGFSLPPKDRINAELQSSDFYLSDYHYYCVDENNNPTIWDLLNDGDSLNMFQNATNDAYNKNIYRTVELLKNNGKYSLDNDKIAADKTQPLIESIRKYGVIPDRDLYSTGYNNTMFVDESICTFNSPEIDYVFGTQLEPFYLNQYIDVCGYAQVTSSQSLIDISNTQFKTNNVDGSIRVDKSSKYEIIGKCLFNLIDEERVDDDTVLFLNNFTQKFGIPNQPLPYTAGPWWLDTMMVMNFVRKKGNPFEKFNGLFLGYDGNDHETKSSNIFIDDDDISNKIDDRNNIMFVRGLYAKDYPNVRATTSFFGETNLKNQDKDDGKSSTFTVYNYKGSIFYSKNTDSKVKPVIFTDHCYPEIHNDSMHFINPTFFGSNISATFSTLHLTEEYTGSNSDAFWNNYYTNRNLLLSNPTSLAYTNRDRLETLRYGSNATLKQDQTEENAFGTNENTQLGTFSYYFFPFFNIGVTSKWYQSGWETYNDIDFVTHPWLLPRGTNYTNRDTWLNKYAANANNYAELNNWPYIDYWNGSEFGCHYYAPFSTNFIGSVFEPIYPHVVYPFMSNNINVPFCGTTSVYTNDVGNVRPDRNDTHSSLYSSCTNYINKAINAIVDEVTKYNYESFTGYYGAPLLTAENRPEADLSGIPFNKNSIRPIRQLYSFNYVKDKVPQIKHRTLTLTAAMKWYRGFKCFYSDSSRILSSDSQILTRISNGEYINKASIMGNLFFSGYLPQFTVKSGTLIPFNFKDQTAATYWKKFGTAMLQTGNLFYAFISSFNVLNTVAKATDPIGWAMSSIFSYTDADDYLFTPWYQNNFTYCLHRDDLYNLYNVDALQNISLDFNATPHIVYYTQKYDDTLTLLPRFIPIMNAAGSRPYRHIDINDASLMFEASHYYKPFINEMLPDWRTAVDNKNDDWDHDSTRPSAGESGHTLPSATENRIKKFPIHVRNARNWYKTTYPHTGHFEQLMFPYLHRAQQPYWNRVRNGERVLSAYPFDIHQDTYNIDLNTLIQYDDRGSARQAANYMLLPIANIYNKSLLKQTGGISPYQYKINNGLTGENWDWKICGYTYSIEQIINEFTINRKATIRFLEGDTYFQRYNCFKTVDKDITTASDVAEDSVGEEMPNNVTETASVMIESYYNLDGLYWYYNYLIGYKESMLVRPLFNNMKQINPVYSIKNDLCDVFKEVDTSYWNSNLNHYPAQILWSIQKQEGESIDSWGIVPQTNQILISGEMGAINKLISFSDQVFCLQDHGFSALNYDPQFVAPTSTDSTMSIYLSDSTKLQGVSYLSREVGTLNKWSVAKGQGGIYWIDETLQRFCNYGSVEGGISDISHKFGFKSWSIDHITPNNCVWTADSFRLNNTTQRKIFPAFKANYDLLGANVYWSNGQYCICFNELLQAFTSFYSYEKTPYKFNFLGSHYSIVSYLPDIDSSSLWLDHSTFTHTTYDEYFNSYIELLVNPSGLYDKVFNFIEYNLECYKPQEKNEFIPWKNTYNKISVKNMYQEGTEYLNNKNTKERFRLWRTTIPRENGTINRIRSPWCRVKLERDVPSNYDKFTTKDDTVLEFKDKLYYINVNYTIPEQPSKSNIQQ